MHDAIDAAPFGQYLHKRTCGERTPPVSGRQQRDSDTLACRCYQYFEAARRHAGLHCHGGGLTARGREMPGPATLLLMVEDGKVAEVRGRSGLAAIVQECRTCDEDPPAHADPLHLKVGIGVQSFANPYRHVDALMDEIDPSIGYDAFDAKHRMIGEKRGQRSGDAFLEPERAAQPDEPARLRLHPERGFVRCVGFYDNRLCMLEDLLTDLGQTQSPRGPVSSRTPKRSSRSVMRRLIRDFGTPRTRAAAENPRF